MNNFRKTIKKDYPQLKPSRPAGFSPTADLKGVIVTGFDEDVAILIEGRDLDKLNGMLQLVTKQSTQNSTIELLRQIVERDDNITREHTRGRYTRSKSTLTNELRNLVAILDKENKP